MKTDNPRGVYSLIARKPRTLLDERNARKDPYARAFMCDEYLDVCLNEDDPREMADALGVPYDPHNPDDVWKYW